jgi:hypothetical protein
LRCKNIEIARLILKINACSRLICLKNESNSHLGGDTGSSSIDFAGQTAASPERLAGQATVEQKRRGLAMNNRAVQASLGWRHQCTDNGHLFINLV